MRRGARTRRPAHRGAVALATALIVAASLPAAVWAAHFWTIGTSISSVTQHVSTAVTVTVQNTSTNNGGGDSIGCVRIAIPNAYTVDSVTIDSVSRGFIWYHATWGSPTSYVTLWADDDGNRLRGDDDFDVLVATITVTGQTVGSQDWIATEFEKPDCTQQQLSATLPMTVTSGVNAAPGGVADSYGVVAGTSLIEPAAGVLANDTDPDGDPITATLIGDVSFGTLVLSADGAFTYDPDPGFVGTDGFTYQATDGSDPSATTTVTIDVTNVVTTTAPDAYPASKNILLTIPVGSGVLANDTDPDAAAGQPLTVALVSGPASGTLNLAADGSFTFDPPPDTTGPFAFTYEVSDTVGTTAPETVTISVANDAPLAVDDAYATHMNSPLVAPPAVTVTANDTDANGDPLMTDLVSGPAHGILVLAPDGAFTYTPDLFWIGGDSFSYRVTDGTDWSAPATVTIAVSNGQPSAVDDASSGSHDRTQAGDVLANDLDPDGDPLTAQLGTDVTFGTLSLDPDGSWTYAPAAGYIGPDSFTYRASDGETTSGWATVTIDVTNAAPTAADDAWSVTHDRVLVVKSPGVRAGDSDPDGDVLTASLLSGPSNGQLSGGAIAANGGFTYVPDPGFIGTDSFTYRVSDGWTTASATVHITVTDRAPVAVADAWSVRHDRELVIAAPGVLGNDSDADGDSLSAARTSSPAHGTASIAANGRVTYTPDAGYVGPDSFTYRASDGVASTTATVRVEVTNATPVAVGDQYPTVGSERLDVDPGQGVLGNDFDDDGDGLSVTLTTGAAHGSVSLDPTGAFGYVPADGFVGIDSFSYTATDDLATSTPAVVLLTVSAPPSPEPTPTPVTPEETPPPGPIPTGPPSSGGEVPPEDTWSIGGDASSPSGDTTQLPIANLAASTLGLFGKAFDWLVPGALVTVPGLLLIVVVAAQMFGALAWLPLVRRKIGGFGFGETTRVGAVGRSR